MPRINVSTYEYEQDLLPMVCAKCGRPAEHRVLRHLRHLDCDKSPLLAFGVLVGLLVFPPLFFLFGWRLAEVIGVRIPMCETHREDWHWRDRAEFWFLVPVWVLGVLTLHAFGVMYLVKGDTDNAAYAFGSAVGAFFVVALAEVAIIQLGAVKVSMQAKNKGIRLAGVHEDFVAALAEDRARDRVDNPQRRCLQRADMQDDFDDEVL